MGWAEAGRGWGERAVEWAYLLEPYARPANELLFDRLRVSDGVRLLDIACGSGFAAQLASDRGAVVAGLDAAEALVTVARARTPAGDFRVGDMFALPFADDCFDVRQASTASGRDARAPSARLAGSLFQTVATE